MSRCPATTKKGKACKNTGFPKYGGYCHVHRGWSTTKTGEGKFCPEAIWRPKIFISYRRHDAAYPAHAIYDALIPLFDVFFDVDKISIGVDFHQVLNEAVEECDVLLAVIGDHWLTSEDDTGQRRLDSPDDFVRIEIEAALSSHIPVVPVLVGNALAPKQVDLPESLKALATRHAGEVRPGNDFKGHLARLVQGIKNAVDAAKGTRFYKLKILFADDEVNLQEIMRTELERMGHSVVVCPDGPTAVAALEKEPFDCLIVDLDMPGLTGIEVIAKARELHPDIDAVVLTGKPTQDTAIAAVRYQAFEYITKPCPFSEFSDMLRRVGQHRKAKRRLNTLG